MEIRKATITELPQIMEIYRYAQHFMAENGNPGQWGTSYPDEEMIGDDISRGHCYLCLEQSRPAGVFMFMTGEEEPAYRTLLEGAWHAARPYGTIHRVAANGTARGVAKACFDYCKSKADYLRIDTHENNLPMRNALSKNGFLYCGIIEDYGRRLTYDFDGLIAP